MRCLAIITARGASKRIPRKNIRPFLGKPIIAYSITAALEAKIFDEVMVSTDDKEIAAISEKLGANIPFIRSKKASDDYATTNDVIKEVLESYLSIGKSFDYACCLYPTAPFVTGEILKVAFQILKTGKSDLVLPITPFSFPVQRSFIKKEDGEINYSQPDFINSRSQDLEKHFHDVGQFYFFKVVDYLHRGALISENMHGIEIDELHAQDIDNESDWNLAELKYKHIDSSKKGK